MRNSDDLKQSGANILQMDVSDDHSMQNGIEEIIKNEGHIDILINNAGFGSFCFSVIYPVTLDIKQYSTWIIRGFVKGGK